MYHVADAWVMSYLYIKTVYMVIRVRVRVTVAIVHYVDRSPFHNIASVYSRCVCVRWQGLL